MLKINIIATWAYPCSIEINFERAFKQLGHAVNRINLNSRDCYITDADINLLIKYPIDKIHMEGTSVYYMLDNFYRFPHFYEKALNYEYDHYFYVHHTAEDIKRFLPSYRIVPEKHTKLNVGYDPMDHHPINSGQDIDVLFCGTNHSPERNWIQQIENITLFGNGWNPAIRDIYGEEKQKIYGRAKLILNHTLKNDDHTMRFYEALAMCPRGLLLTDKYPKGEEWVPGYHFVQYTSKEDLEQKIRYYLDHEAERIAIAEQGFKTVTEGKYTYKDRMEEMLRVINERNL